MGRGSRQSAAVAGPRDDIGLLRQKVEENRMWSSVLDAPGARKSPEDLTHGEALFLRYQLLLELRENDQEAFADLPDALFAPGVCRESTPREIVASFLENAFLLPQNEHNLEILEELFSKEYQKEILEHVRSSDDLSDSNAMQLALLLSSLASDRSFPANEAFINDNWSEIRQMSEVGGRYPNQRPLLVSSGTRWVCGQGSWSGACLNLDFFPGKPRVTVFSAHPERIPLLENRLRCVLVHECIHQVQTAGAEASFEWTESITDGLAVLRTGSRELSYSDLVAGMYTLIEESGGDLLRDLEEFNDLSEEEGWRILSERIGGDAQKRFEEILEEEPSFEIIDQALEDLK